MNKFLISDTHFGARGHIEPFTSSAERDAALIERWNATVSGGDYVMLLGDIATNEASLGTLNKLHGRKMLMLGNHDRLQVHKYMKYAVSMRPSGIRIESDIILSHIPIYPQDLTYRNNLINVHGHNHGYMIDDPRYFSVAAEVNNYTPVPLERVIEYRDKIRRSASNE